MSVWTAHRDRQHSLFTQGLRDLLTWLEQDVTIPVPEQLPIVIKVDTAQHLADVAIGHDLDGPHTALDGSVFLYRYFTGDVSWQAVTYRHPDGAGESERHARAWAASHNLILVPRVDSAGGQP